MIPNDILMSFSMSLCAQRFMVRGEGGGGGGGGSVKKNYIVALTPPVVACCRTCEISFGFSIFSVFFLFGSRS